MNQYINEGYKVAAVLHPIAVTSTEKVTGAVDMSKYERVAAVFAFGDMAAETIDFRLETDTVSTFDASKATLVAATQLGAHATNNDNKAIVLEAKAENMPEGDRYLRGRAVTGSTTGGPGCIIIFGKPHSSKEGNVAAVVEVKRA